MRAVPSLSAREVADFAGAPTRVVEKAIEERVLAPRRLARRKDGRSQRFFPPHAVAYVAVVAKLGLPLPAAHKKRLASTLACLPTTALRSAHVELSPALDLDVGRLVGDAVERAERYAHERDRHIETKNSIKGGTPVIRGTWMTVYAVLGRIKHGESLDDLVADNPDIPHGAFE